VLPTESVAVDDIAAPGWAAALPRLSAPLPFASVVMLEVLRSD